MANYTIKQGEPLAVELPLFNLDNSVVDLSLATDIRCLIYLKNNIVAKYASSVIVGYDLLTIKAGTTNTLELNLTRAQTALFNLGKMTASVVVKWSNTNIVNYDLSVGTVYEGLAKGEILI